MMQCRHSKVIRVIAMNKIRTYSELIKLETFEERFEYLKLTGEVGFETFGDLRYVNQNLYHSNEWRSVRDYCIVRDHGCDLACLDREIQDQAIYLHHMNPLTAEDILQGTELVLDPEFLITTIFNTHNAIHYGDINNLIRDPILRKPNDMCPWKL